MNTKSSVAIKGKAARERILARSRRLLKDKRHETQIVNGGSLRDERVEK